MSKKGLEDCWKRPTFEKVEDDGDCLCGGLEDIAQAIREGGEGGGVTSVNGYKGDVLIDGTRMTVSQQDKRTVAEAIAGGGEGGMKIIKLGYGGLLTQDDYVSIENGTAILYTVDNQQLDKLGETDEVLTYGSVENKNNTLTGLVFTINKSDRKYDFQRFTNYAPSYLGKPGFVLTTNEAGDDTEWKEIQSGGGTIIDVVDLEYMTIQEFHTILDAYTQTGNVTIRTQIKEDAYLCNSIIFAYDDIEGAQFIIAYEYNINSYVMWIYENGELHTKFIPRGMQVITVYNEGGKLTKEEYNAIANKQAIVMTETSEQLLIADEDKRYLYLGYNVPQQGTMTVRVWAINKETYDYITRDDTGYYFAELGEPGQVAKMSDDGTRVIFEDYKGTKTITITTEEEDGYPILTVEDFDEIRNALHEGTDIVILNHHDYKNEKYYKVINGKQVVLDAENERTYFIITNYFDDYMQYCLSYSYGEMSVSRTKIDIGGMSGLEIIERLGYTPQPKLTAGQNITIDEDNVISATGVRRVNGKDDQDIVLTGDDIATSETDNTTIPQKFEELDEKYKLTSVIISNEPEYITENEFNEIYEAYKANGNVKIVRDLNEIKVIAVNGDAATDTIEIVGIEANGDLMMWQKTHDEIIFNKSSLANNSVAIKFEVELDSNTFLPIIDSKNLDEWLSYAKRGNVVSLHGIVRNVDRAYTIQTATQDTIAISVLESTGITNYIADINSREWQEA